MADNEKLQTTIHLGTEVGYLQQKRKFGIFHDDIFQHIWANGQTGVGKSTILKVLYAHLAQEGFGLTLVDFNGDLADEALDITPSHRIDDVVFCDLADPTHAIPTNPFHEVPPSKRVRITSQFVKTLEHIYQDSWGHRMNHMLKATIRALLEAPAELQPTIFSISHVLTNQHYRQKVFAAVKDPELRAYIKNEFETLTPHVLRQNAEAILNKIGDFTENPYVLHHMGSYKPTFKFSSVIKANSILILRLPKGLVGEAAKLYGSLAVSEIINEAYAQQDLRPTERNPHYLLIDEILNIEHSCLIDPVSETRKYMLGLTASSQFTRQLHPDLRHAFLGNVGTVIAYRCSQDDAELFSKTFGEYHPRQFTSLDRGEALMRMTKHGSPYGAFRAEIDPADVPFYGLADNIREKSQRTYGVENTAVFKNYTSWVKKEILHPEETRERRQQVSTKQKNVAREKYVRHIEQTTGRELTPPEREAKFREISDMLKTMGKNDPRWPQGLNLHKKTHRSRKRRSANYRPCNN